MNLYNYQQQIVDTAPNRYGLWLRMGVGKTATALGLAKKRNEVPLIICPKSLSKNWQRECNVWGVENYLIITKEEFKRDWEILERYNFIVFDEFHWFLGMKSAMHKKTKSYLAKHQPEYIYGLTATPILSSAWNVYCSELLLGHMPSYKWYKQTFFKTVKMGTYMKFGKILPRMVDIPIPENQHLLIEILNRIGVTLRMEDVTEVPEYTFIREDFGLNAEQRKAISELDDPTPIAFYTKSFQIENGTLKSDGYTENRFFKSEKCKRVIELIENTEKLIVVCHHTLEIEMIASKIKDKKVFKITGKTNGDDRYDLQDIVANSDNCVLLINAAISEGLNFPSMTTIVFYSMSWSIKDREQMEGRNQRRNDLRKNTYIDMVVLGGVDEGVYDCIKKKKDFNVEIYAIQNKKNSVVKK